MRFVRRGDTIRIFGTGFGISIAHYIWKESGEELARTDTTKPGSAEAPAVAATPPGKLPTTGGSADQFSGLNLLVPLAILLGLVAFEAMRRKQGMRNE